MAAVDIQTNDVLEGHLPPKALAMVREWVLINQERSFVYVGNSRV